MFDLIFSIGQAAAVLVVIYGGYLILVPSREARRREPATEDVVFLEWTTPKS